MRERIPVLLSWLLPKKASAAVRLDDVAGKRTRPLPKDAPRSAIRYDSRTPQMFVPRRPSVLQDDSDASGAQTKNVPTRWDHSGSLPFCDGPPTGSS